MIVREWLRLMNNRGQFSRVEIPDEKHGRQVVVVVNMSVCHLGSDLMWLQHILCLTPHLLVVLLVISPSFLVSTRHFTEAFGDSPML